MPNPFASSRWYHRLSNAFMPTLFRLLPVPRGFALLTVTGRRSGRPRRRPVRAIRNGNTYYTVAILGQRSDWLRNATEEPRVRLKTGRRTHSGTVRQVTDPEEQRQAGEMYANVVVPYDYVDYPMVHWDFPTRRKIIEAHRDWVREGVLVAIDVV